MTEGLDEGPILLSETAAHRRPGHGRLAARPPRRARRAAAAARAGRLGARDRARDAAGRRRRHLRQEDQARRGAHRLDRARRRPSTGASAASRPFPAPGSLIEGAGTRVRIKALLSRRRAGRGRAGARCWTTRLLVACGEGAVRILRAQREGRARAGRGGLPARISRSALARGSADAALPPHGRIRRRPYHGFQAQGDLPSVQASIERAVNGVLRRGAPPAGRRAHRRRRACDRPGHPYRSGEGLGCRPWCAMPSTPISSPSRSPSSTPPRPMPASTPGSRPRRGATSTASSIARARRRWSAGGSGT